MTSTIVVTRNAIEATLTDIVLTETAQENGEVMTFDNPDEAQRVVDGMRASGKFLTVEVVTEEPSP
jgi:hypothetical protein